AKAAWRAANYSGLQVDATRVQSSRRERVYENSLKAELSTGRTHLPTAISRKKAGNANENRCFQRTFSSPSASRQQPSQILTLKVVKRVVGAYTSRPRLTPLYRCDKLRQEEQAVARAACFLAIEKQESEVRSQEPE